MKFIEGIVIKVTLENYPKIKDTDRIKRNGVWIENLV